MPPSKSTIVVERFLHGRRIKLLVEDPREYIQSHWARGEIYEHGLYGTDAIRSAAGAIVSRISKRVRGHERLGMLGFVETHYRAGTFVDVGGSIGNHSLFFAVACAAERVIAFEPVPELAAHFREVMKANGVDDRVELVQAACGDREGTVRFQRGTSKNAGLGRVSDREDRGEEVPVTTIDRACKDLRDLTLMKIDVEGYNLPVLRGAKETIRKFTPDIFVECDGTDDLAAIERELGDGYVRRTDIVFNKTPTYLFGRK